MNSSNLLWNNSEAGNHPLPDDSREVGASIRAAERCMAHLPYLGLRFGKRGDAFARTDSGYLTTLVRFPQEYLNSQVNWLARVLAFRGMPRWLMEVHLDFLADDLTSAIPERRRDYDKLRVTASQLRKERQNILPEHFVEAMAAEFSQRSGNAIPYFGETILSAVCDEACGIDTAVSSITHWLESNPARPSSLLSSVGFLLERAYSQIGEPRR